MLTQLWALVYRPLLDAIQHEHEIENLHGILEAFGESMAPLETTMLTDHQIQEINLILVGLIQSSHERRAEREKARAEPDFDEQEGEGHTRHTTHMYTHTCTHTHTERERVVSSSMVITNLAQHTPQL